MLVVQENMGSDVVVLYFVKFPSSHHLLTAASVPFPPHYGLLGPSSVLRIEDFDGGKGKKRLNKTTSWTLSLNGKIYSVFGRVEIKES